MGIINPKHYQEFYRAAKNGDLKEGVIKGSARLVGVYTTSFNGGQDLQVDENLIPDEGILYCLNVWLGAFTKPTGLYLAPFNGGNPPDSGWTGGNFTANAQEIVSTNPGFSNATRPAWVPSEATDPAVGIDNIASRAVFNTVCPGSSVLIAGVGLIANDSVRGGVTGTLVSAMRYDNTRTSNDNDAFEVGYTVKLTDS